ncbi:MAG: hypothetical protein IT304_00990 [Dehalococcoidia bacterium]|nr:hypothetical protein [Dehalococcoidia bacterium]
MPQRGTKVAQPRLGKPRLPPTLRGLGLGLALSAVNLVGALLVLSAVGGLGSWTSRQFVGIFGLVELGTGVAFVLGPNVWRMPVQAAAGERVVLEPRQLLVPHWAGSVKCLAGALFLAWAAAGEGRSTASALLLPFALLLPVGGLGLSLVAARFGTTRPDLDVVTLVIRRPERPERPLPPVSLSAAVVQVVVNLGAFPLVLALPPSILYRPEIAPSPALLWWSAAVSLALAAAGLLAWRGRFVRRADAPVRPSLGPGPREEKRERP